MTQKDVPEFLEVENLPAGAVDYDFDIDGIKVRCVKCHGVIETTPKNLKQLLTFYRKHGRLSLRSQFRFRIPFLKKEVTFTLWDVYQPVQPKTFMR